MTIVDRISQISDREKLSTFALQFSSRHHEAPNLTFAELYLSEDKNIRVMSALASSIVKEYYDSLLGEEQNAYMIEMFQSYDSIKNQLAAGKRYFFVRENGDNIGFI